MNETLVYSVPEVARELKISRNNAYVLVREGKLPAVKIGERRWVVPKQALEEWLKEQTMKQAVNE